MLMNKLNDYLYHGEQNDINYFIARYIKMHIDVIEKMTINELADECFVSKAKIFSFCKALGYDNFISFKEDCAKETKKKIWKLIFKIIYIVHFKSWKIIY